MKPWHEDDEFWLHFAPVLFGPEKWAAAMDEMRKTALMLGLEKGERVLDACCGVGRHSIELTRAGYMVTGVDRTAPFLDAARETAEAEGFDIEFIQSDLRTFTRPNSYDAAINMFTSLGYFDDIEDERVLVRNIYESLKPGGRFLVDVIGKEILAREFKPRDWYRDECGLVISEYRVVDNWSRLFNYWFLMDENGTYEYTFSHRIFSGSELASLLKECGFIDIQVYGSLEKAPYDEKAEQLIAVGVKPSRH